MVRLAIILLGALHLDELERVLNLAWVGFCAYTWVAPAVFRRMLQSELQNVVLRPDF